ncbi:DNA-binding transcriptional LysR family regulator [Sinobacterium caligoides]|uniref:DNA-binding transcriptional LysR family regulator n=1 Tax=Sinobacterium caligoides TaxID=933926 RepID=A0A3N2DKB9_9GAMM|nr:LysR family transcriptional regulator [Sinobacterium caligoides]ROS00251.1 DNA-binding transcriptional LysR family regulator [Sinobacterium caligoides]
MGQLEDMQMFIRVVDAGGIGRAADQLGIAKSAVSRRLSELEERLGTRLIQRTTRRSSLTDFGGRYYQEAMKIVDHIAEINCEATKTATDVSGVLRVAVPLSFGLLHLSPAIDLFTQRYPDIVIQVDFSDREVDLVEEGFDLAIRIANLKDSSLQARKISTVRHRLVASPDYLSRKGAPHSPEALMQHDILSYGYARNFVWTIDDTEGVEHQLKLNSKMATNSGDFLAKMSVAGHGISMLPSFICWKSLAAGDLVTVLPECGLPTLTAFAVYPRSRFLPLRARLFIDFILERFGDNPYWDHFD